MAPQKTLHQNRYPGIRSFEEKDKNLFYGRTREIEELFHFIKIKPLVVLFGKSGLGKTSLLKAGVGPLLIRQKFYPIIIRLQDVSISPITTVLTALEPFVDKEMLKKYGGKSKNKIWETLQATKFTNEDGTTATPVIVFDQFEELFNHPLSVQEEWTNCIGDIIEERVPKDVEDAIYKIPRSQRDKKLMNWYTPRMLRVVFAIRSDRMSELHQLRYEIPEILQNRYELKPLNISQAKEAIEKPAALSSTKYTTAPFTFAPETIDKIQQELSNEQREIESFQLQIVCQHIEQQVKQRQDNSEKNIVVSPDFLGDKAGIKKILKSYYKTQLALLGNEDEQLAARRLMEEGLIMNNRRISVAEAVVQEQYEIDDELLTRLLNSRLLRPEDTRLGRTYEISHDTLVKPILEAYEKRRIQEERLAVREKRKKEEKETLRRQKIRNLSIVGILLAGLATFAFVQSVRASNKAKQLTKINDKLKLTQDSVLKQQQALAEESLEKESTIAKLLDYASFDLGDRERGEILEEIDSLIAKKQRAADQQFQSQQRKKEEINALTSKLFSRDESVRSKNAYELRKRFSNEPLLTASLINSSKEKINKDNLNSIYQVIYILENSSAKALKAKKSEVEEFLLKVRNSNLVGNATKIRLARIENKLL